MATEPIVLAIDPEILARLKHPEWVVLYLNGVSPQQIAKRVYRTPAGLACQAAVLPQPTAAQACECGGPGPGLETAAARGHGLPSAARSPAPACLSG